MKRSTKYGLGMAATILAAVAMVPLDWEYNLKSLGTFTASDGKRVAAFCGEGFPSASHARRLLAPEDPAAGAPYTALLYLAHCPGLTLTWAEDTAEALQFAGPGWNRRLIIDAAGVERLEFERGRL